MQSVVQLWRYHNRRKIWISYAATFEDDALVHLRNLTNGYDIPLNTQTARLIAKKNEKFLIYLPGSVLVPTDTKMRYVQRHETRRYSSA